MVDVNPVRIPQTPLKRRSMSDLGPTRPANAAAADGLAAALAAARSRLAGDGSGAAAARPRLVTFGETGAVRSLLTALFRESPFPAPAPPPPDQTVWWRWWLGERLVVVEMAPALLAAPVEPADWGAVEAALGLLAGDRRGRPMDGYVLVLPADLLAAHPDRAGDAAARLRAIAGEAAATLGWRAPVHLVVTGLQAVPGHDAFFAALPARTGNQPLGVRFDPVASDQRISGGRQDRPSRQNVAGWFSTLTRRLRQLRIGVLLAGSAETNRDGVFRFVEGLPALAPGLAAAAEGLAADGARINRSGAEGPDPDQSDPERPDPHRSAPGESPDMVRLGMVRSVYLTAPDAAASHLEDVADRFLVADAGLAGPVRPKPPRCV